MERLLGAAIPQAPAIGIVVGSIHRATAALSGSGLAIPVADRMERMLDRWVTGTLGAGVCPRMGAIVSRPETSER